MNPNAWSPDADSNDRIDPPILWPEGQDPGSVNNSARAMMAAIACLLQDTGGSLIATGTNAYALSLARTIGDYGSSFAVAFRVTNENTGPATLSVNGLAALPIVRRFGRQLGPGDLTQNVLYTAAFIPAIGSYLLTSPDIPASGMVRMQAGPGVDPGWLPCDGRAVSRTAYITLFNAIGTNFGPGDGSTSFNLPDMRGRAPFGADDNAGRLTGVGGLNGNLGAVGGDETVTLTSGQMPIHAHTGTAQDGGASDGGATGPAGDHDHGGQTGPAGAHGHTATVDQGGSHTHSGTAGVAGGEARKFAFVGGSGTIQGGAQPYVADINASGVFPGGANERQTSTDPGHQHPVTIPQSGEHGHTASVSTAENHQHSIQGSGTHVHSLPAAAAHTHPLTINDAGGGQGHPNIPPGLVVLFVIKT